MLNKLPEPNKTYKRKEEAPLQLMRIIHKYELGENQCLKLLGWKFHFKTALSELEDFTLSCAVDSIDQFWEEYEEVLINK